MIILSFKKRNQPEDRELGDKTIKTNKITYLCKMQKKFKKSL
jgi:hypothetical protein